MAEQSLHVLRPERQLLRSLACLILQQPVPLLQRVPEFPGSDQFPGFQGRQEFPLRAENALERSNSDICLYEFRQH